MNWTLATATLSKAVAVKVTNEPDTVAPSEGAAKDTEGGVVPAAILGVIEGEVLVVDSLGASTGGEARRMPVGDTNTVTWIVELPGLLLIAPNTSMENESCPLKAAWGE
jgi:hypothetical protein